MEFSKIMPYFETSNQPEKTMENLLIAKTKSGIELTIAIDTTSPNTIVVISNGAKTVRQFSSIATRIELGAKESYVTLNAKEVETLLGAKISGTAKVQIVSFADGSAIPVMAKAILLTDCRENSIEYVKARLASKNEAFTPDTSSFIYKATGNKYADDFATKGFDYAEEN